MGGTNTYGYVKQNPVMRTDPNGLFDVGLGSAIGLTQGAGAALGGEPDGYVLQQTTRCIAGGAIEDLGWDIALGYGLGLVVAPEFTVPYIIGRAGFMAGYGVYSSVGLVDCVLEKPKGSKPAPNTPPSKPPEKPKPEEPPFCPTDFPGMGTPPSPDCNYTTDPTTGATIITCSKYH